MLRDAGSNEEHIVIISNNGYWYHDLREGTADGETVASKYSPHINTSQGSTNHVRVIALEDVGWLFINGNYIAELDLSGGLETGTVILLGSWFRGDQHAGETTGFEGFTVRSLQTVYGPEEGAIDHNPDDDDLELHSSATWLADSVVEARFNNPFSTSEGGWSPGFALRNSAFSVFHVIGISHKGYWYHYVGTEPSVPSEQMQWMSSKHIATGPSGSNSLRVIALGNEGWLFINDAYVSELDLSGLSMPGEIFALDNYFSDTGIAGKSTNFDGFVVWSVGDE